MANSLWCSAPVMEKSAYLFPTDKRKGLSPGASLFLQSCGEGAFLGSFPSILRKRQKAREREAGIGDTEVKDESGKAQEKVNMGQHLWGTDRRHSRNKEREETLKSGP